MDQKHKPGCGPAEKPFVSAVIVAAGQGRRMGSDADKQLILLADVPVIARTLSAFEAALTVDEVVVVCNPNNIMVIGGIVREFGFRKVVRVVRGGATRQQSAVNGLDSVSSLTSYIAVHDGARPFITPEEIDRVVQTAFEKKAAAAAARVKDTVKIVDGSNRVLSTPERASLMAVQTPQVFEIEVYRNSMRLAREQNAEYTDDCQLLERAGEPVFLVDCGYRNIKITTQEDLAFAEVILRMRSDT